MLHRGSYQDAGDGAHSGGILPPIGNRAPGAHLVKTAHRADVPHPCTPPSPCSRLRPADVPGSDQPKNKNAGGQPPGLRRTLYSRYPSFLYYEPERPSNIGNRSSRTHHVKTTCMASRPRPGEWARLCRRLRHADALGFCSTCKQKCRGVSPGPWRISQLGNSSGLYRSPLRTTGDASSEAS